MVNLIFHYPGYVEERQKEEYCGCDYNFNKAESPNKG